MLNDFNINYSECNPNFLVSHYLVHAYIYYELNDNIISDSKYDLIARTMLEKWDDITHPHKKYLTKSIVKAATQPLGYPEIVKDTAKLLLSE